MGERIEGFCTKEEWQRAYREINDMEAHLANSGAIVMKFWMQIDKDEQERRFKERMENPEKQWKITDEDWRNREKWEQYEEAVNEMIIKTSTSYAPWTIVEGNCKYYARIKVLETVVNEIEKRLKKTDQEKYMLNWYKNLYIGDNAKKKSKKLIHKINQGAGVIDCYTKDITRLDFLVRPFSFIPLYLPASTQVSFLC